MREFWHKLRQVSIGAAPIVLIILCIHFFVKPMPTELLVAFLISCVLLILGQALFLVGVDSSILTMGELVGSNIRKLKSIWVILLFGFLFGTMATVAEPAVTLVAESVHSVNRGINAIMLTWVVSSGIGIFVAYALLRIFKQLSIKWSFLIAYIIVFILIFITPKEFQAVAFDFSGATTGVVTVPFILALGVGITLVLNRGKENSYGMIGLASIGPIITMCIMGIIFGGGSGGEFPAVERPHAGMSILTSFREICTAMVPIIIIFLIFNFAFLKLPRRKIWHIMYGMLITVCGLILLLTAVNYGFANAGRHIGNALADTGRAEWFKYLLIPLGLLLGFVITYTEPDIRVLANQIEQNTNGQIRRGTLIFTLAMGLSLTVCFGMMRILFKIDFLWFVIPIFILAFCLMPFISKMFVGIAFDSGGVASGTITAAFFVPLAVGVSATLGGREAMVYGFGMIALIVIMPMVAVSGLGLVYALKLKKLGAAGIGQSNLQGQNMFIGVVFPANAEHKVTEKLSQNGASIVTVLHATGAARSFVDFNLHRRLFILALVSRARADTIMESFTTTDANLMAFTVPIDEMGI
jgi:hypothetical protein